MLLSDAALLRTARSLVERRLNRSTWSAVTVLSIPHARELGVPRIRPVDAQRLWERWERILRPAEGASPVNRISVLAAFDRAIAAASKESQAMPETTAAVQEPPPPTAPVQARVEGAAQREEFARVPLDRIYDKGNVREVTAESVTELVESIKQQGVTVPIVLARRTDPKADTAGRPYVCVAGFRRLFAARKAGLKDIPAVIRTLSGEQIAEQRLVENLQREDLSEIEEAKAFRDYLGAPGRTQAELAQRLGKSQPYVSNRLRLLGLPDDAVVLLEKRKLTASAAEEILALPKGGKERDTVVRHAVEMSKQTRGAVGAADLEYTLRQASLRAQKRTQLEQAREFAKFPSCPVEGCGKIGSRIPWDAASTSVAGGKGYSVSKLGCAGGHEWSTTTGKAADRDGGGARTTLERSSPPKPTLPEVDPIVNGGPPVGAVARRLIDSIEAVGFVSLRWDGKHAEIRLSVQVPKTLTALPPFSTLGSTPKMGVYAVASIQSWNQTDDAGRKRCARDRTALESWFAGIRQRGRPKKSVPAKPRGKKA